MSKYKGIFKRSGATNYTTSIKRFDRVTGAWVWVYVSTHTSDPLKALKTRDELQLLEDAAASNKDSSMTRQKALDILNRILVWHGIPEIEDATGRAVSISKFIAGFMTDLRRTDLGEVSAKSYEARLIKFAEFVGPSSVLRSITHRQVQDYLNGLSDSGLSSKTVSDHKKIIKRLFAEAHEEGLCSVNPATKAKIEAVRYRRKEPFTVSEIGDIMQALKGRENETEWRIVCLFGLCLGARLNDCTIRRWEEIDLEGGRIVYTPGKTAKHGTTVKAPLVNPLLSCLRSIAGDESGFITPTLAEIQVNNGLTQTFSAILEEAGIEMKIDAGAGAAKTWRSKGFHSYRHTLPTMLAAANVPAEIRMGIVGHTQAATHNGYTHKDESQMRAGLESALAGLPEF